jgi:predicted pyridoxine 5'-phosphate oxidase superfamily flavin-nucleotide-binding protein
MPHAFADIAFTPRVKTLQQQLGSRESYAKMESAPGQVNLRLESDEAQFLATRDSFFLGTVGETGWPYIQHRGGPPGFVRVLGDSLIGFADFRGNRQYVSLGNLGAEDRVSMFFIDYPTRTRLKVFGRARAVALDDAETMQRLEVPGYAARVERGILVEVAGYDWNCPQHITPRFTEEQIQAQVQVQMQEQIRAQVEARTAVLAARVAHLEGELAKVTA